MVQATRHFGFGHTPMNARQWQFVWDNRGLAFQIFKSWGVHHKDWPELWSDVALAALINVARRVKEIGEAGANPTAYAAIAIQNGLKTRFRRHSERFDLLNRPNCVFAIVDDETGLCVGLEDVDLKDEVDHYLSVLDAENRQIVWMAYGEEYSEAEIAKILKMKRSTVNLRKTKSMSLLRSTFRGD